MSKPVEGAGAFLSTTHEVAARGSTVKAHGNGVCQVASKNVLYSGLRSRRMNLYDGRSNVDEEENEKRTQESTPRAHIPKFLENGRFRVSFYGNFNYIW